MDDVSGPPRDARGRMRSNRENEMKHGIPLLCLYMIGISQGLCLTEMWIAVCAQRKLSTDAWTVVHGSITVKTAVSRNIAIVVSSMFRNDGEVATLPL